MAQVRLGSVAFDLGPRREIRFVGSQRLARQDIPGTGPSYQDMGPDESTASWDGILDGPAAVDTALAIDALRESAGAVELVTGVIPAVKVRVREFNYRPRRKDRVEYDITLVKEGVTPEFVPPVPTTSESSTTMGAASQTYTVVSGDTLYAIAQKYMGDGGLWPAIAALNGITDPATLQVGTVLTVPTVHEASTLASQYKGSVSQKNALLSWVDYKLSL